MNTGNLMGIHSYHTFVRDRFDDLNASTKWSSERDKAIIKGSFIELVMFFF